MGYRYDRATRPCSGGTLPGTDQLYDAILASSRWPNALALGTYNCRTVAGTSTLSVHGNGRALDIGFAHGPTGEGEDLAAWLVEHYDELGIQTVIYNRRIWGAGRPVLRTYRGANPHTDHVHAEQHKRAALTLTRAQIAAVLAGSDPSQPGPQPPELEDDDVPLMLVQAEGEPAVWLTDGITRRQVQAGDDLAVCTVLVGTGPKPLHRDWVAAIPIVGRVTDAAGPKYDPPG